jgi:ubiquinone/menaquinone biosynthesis C-methylase UbiE
MDEVDLTRLSDGYQYRPISDAAVRRAKEAVDSLGSRVGVALDVGGGRGSHAEQWVGAARVPVVLDPSMAMLSYVPTSVQRICGRAQAIPLADATVDLVYFHLSIHYGNWRTALEEACRVLMSAGLGRIYTLGSRHHQQSFLNQWFPSVGPLDAQRFPETSDIVRYLEKMGCNVEATPVDETIRTTPSRFKRSVRAGFVSTLQFVGESEMERGLAAFDREYENRDTIEYVLALDRIAWTGPGDVPASSRVGE